MLPFFRELFVGISENIILQCIGKNEIHLWTDCTHKYFKNAIIDISNSLLYLIHFFVKSTNFQSMLKFPAMMHYFYFLFHFCFINSFKT